MPKEQAKKEKIGVQEALKDEARVKTRLEKEISDLLADYSRTLFILGQYDAGKLSKPKGREARFILEYGDCVRIINEIKKRLVVKKVSGDLFGNDAGSKFRGIIGNLYQTFDGQELYKTGEEKAAHLIYLTIKDHPFSDGNKRIASFIFVYFLDKNNFLFKNNGERKINDNALVALALMVAESDPQEKEVMIKIILNLLAE
ncbi:MAG: Fic family protein [Patescibacteria group bacterium]